jgi:hypothetical protein
MRKIDFGFKLTGLALALIAGQGMSLDAAATPVSCKLLTAARVFDGFGVQFDKSVLVVGHKVTAVGDYATLSSQCKTRYNLGDATIMPGLIESHAHIAFQNVDTSKVLEHGITTAQDTGGGALHGPKGGNGTLRTLTTGPILQAAGGYPLNIFTPGDTVGGYDKVGLAIAPDATEAEVRQIVTNLVAGGASAIKISLEPGGEAGAPWMAGLHGTTPPTPWNVLPQNQVNWIVNEAHLQSKKVLAHVGEQSGFAIAVGAGVDAMAHIPCEALDPTMLHDAIDDGMKFISTLDTLSSCGAGMHETAHTLGHVYQLHAADGLEFPMIYGSEIAHDNVPWGFNGEELHLMLHFGSGDSIDFGDVLNVLRAATSASAAFLGTGIAGLGTLSPNAPADVVAFKGNALTRFKLMEYPDLVMSGGKLVVNKFSPTR